RCVLDPIEAKLGVERYRREKPSSQRRMLFFFFVADAMKRKKPRNHFDAIQKTKTNCRNGVVLMETRQRRERRSRPDQERNGETVRASDENSSSGHDMKRRPFEPKGLRRTQHVVFLFRENELDVRCAHYIDAECKLGADSSEKR